MMQNILIAATAVLGCGLALVAVAAAYEEGRTGRSSNNDVWCLLMAWGAIFLLAVVR